MEPDKTGENGDRDPQTGRFLPGNNANPKGRPRGIDFRRVVREKAEQEGIAVEDAVWAIFRSMLKQAGAGDVSAAKLLLDRLCDDDAGVASVEEKAAQILATVEAMRERGA